jgi:hypothetical protein
MEANGDGPLGKHEMRCERLVRWIVAMIVDLIWEKISEFSEEHGDDQAKIEKGGGVGSLTAVVSKIYGPIGMERKSAGVGQTS